MSAYKYLFIFLFLNTGFSGFSQNEAKVWKFGFNTGLNFNSGIPSPIAGASNVVDCSSTISDVNGNLLFYTDGSTVWNRNDVVMPNGSGLISHASAGQCGLIVPIPSSNKYVVFSNTEFASPGQLHYSVVDMSLNSGFGDVIPTQKNISLGTGWTEKLCAIYNCNGDYYWVLMHKWNNSDFVSLKVDASGVTTTSVVTSIGSVHSCGAYSGAHDAMGQLTISRDGTKVINALTCQDNFELFDFNINTGALSNFIFIPGNGGNAWGTGFSADSKKAYVSSIFGAQVYQYDLSVYNAPSIISSKTSLYNTGAGGYNFGYMELGPDNKMYIARPNDSFLSVVNTPNNPGSSCGFSYSGINLSPGISSWGMSRTVYKAALSGAGIPFTASKTNVMCHGEATGSASVTLSAAGSYNYLWSPGNYTTAVVNNLPAGTYTLAISDMNCGLPSYTVITVTQPPALNTQLNAVLNTVCANSTTTLMASYSGGTPSYSMNWSNGVANTNSVVVSPTTTGMYSFTLTDSYNCQSVKSIQISVESIKADFTYTVVPCDSKVSFDNSSINSNSIYWNFGDGNYNTSSSSIINTYPASGIYTVTLLATSLHGCMDSVKKTIAIDTAALSLDFGYFLSKTGCMDSLFLENKSSGATSYQWSFGDGNMSSDFSPTHMFAPGIYTITLTGVSSRCKSSLIKQIEVLPAESIAYEYIPNVFTPNNDGVNDLFDFKTIEPCDEFEFEIFDRWGLSLMKSAEKRQSFWDARTSAGEKVSDGTYFYVITTKSGVRYKGTITVFR